ncbi:hypothetical protein MAXJ12_32384 [Mesorhizobium alhagi CCNWXJ12-2]|uniref:Uncharacterized protein n=1 Tax=Mesorhizobium alhagi CCNWXJ12-2 TaxID=1107882 RepID=H0I1Y1_9HYPH|nr:hypothetical protein MAXJ12_32384 [Mesorhizobium alhagi CCNWXJ12-2]
MSLRSAHLVQLTSLWTFLFDLVASSGLRAPIVQEISRIEFSCISLDMLLARWHISSIARNFAR